MASWNSSIRKRTLPFRKRRWQRTFPIYRWFSNKTIPIKKQIYRGFSIATFDDQREHFRQPCNSHVETCFTIPIRIHDETVSWYKLSFPFASFCCSGNMWIWHRLVSTCVGLHTSFSNWLSQFQWFWLLMMIPNQQPGWGISLAEKFWFIVPPHISRQIQSCITIGTTKIIYPLVI